VLLRFSVQPRDQKMARPGKVFLRFSERRRRRQSIRGASAPGPRDQFIKAEGRSLLRPSLASRRRSSPNLAAFFAPDSLSEFFSRPLILCFRPLGHEISENGAVQQAQQNYNPLAIWALCFFAVAAGAVHAAPIPAPSAADPLLAGGKPGPCDPRLDQPGYIG